MSKAHLLQKYQILVSLEKKLHWKEFRESKQKLENLLSPDFVEFGTSGKVYSRDDILKNLPKGPPVEKSSTDFEIKELAVNTILLTYKTAIKVEQDIVQSIRSSIWIFTKDRWKLFFHQGTKVVGS